ncbi:MAG: hypothetical protein VXW65_12085 [Pseudomonadota bacterium]|nr:hypothetical protein [Pseudomonadota bacterium]
MYIRFVVGGDQEHHKQLTGIVSESRLLRDHGALLAYEEELVEQAYHWLNSNLPCPPFHSGGWSKDAVCWFKDSALEAIKQMRVLTNLLRQHDIPVRILHSKNPGKILYEDHFQVVVEEWKAI